MEGGGRMEEISVENALGLKVFIDGVPDISQMPETEFGFWISALEPIFEEHYENYHKRKGRREGKDKIT